MADPTGVLTIDLATTPAEEILARGARVGDYTIDGLLAHGGFI